MKLCFYCDRELTRRTGGRQEGSAETWDHVVPSWVLKELWKQGKLVNVTHNRVVCCYACNRYKGALLPLDWLVIMPSTGGAIRLRAWLLKQGFGQAEVHEAFSRRKKVRNDPLPTVQKPSPPLQGDEPATCLVADVPGSAV